MKQNVTISLTPEQIKMADERAKELCISRSAHIGLLIQRDHDDIVIPKVGKNDPYWNTPKGVRETIDRG